ncbi:MAG TPA: aminopeptidase N [Actinomycetota bacterium]
MKENLTRDEAAGRAALVRDVAYEIHLDLTGAERFRSQTVIRFVAEPGTSTFLDCTAVEVHAAELNGESLPEGAVTEHRIALGPLAGRNEVRVVADMAYRAGEHGMTRFEDPVDGAVYLFSDAEPFGAHRIYPCFDQPDVKGTFRIDVTAPASWEVASNMAAEAEPEAEGGARRWSFSESPRMSTYLAAVVAGPFHVARDRHGEIDLGIYCRATLAQHLDPDEILEVTKQGFDFFEKAFATPYAFGKYDQVFVPEYAAGAMENPGLVTFNEIHIFRSRVTDARREGRAETILHEMAHMWFGDLVTMRWWDDLWLNETFATFASMLAMERATRFTEPWTSFAHTEKPWASRQDQLPTTHPIVADVPDVESVFLNFDGITYAKGAAVMRQLVAWVGLERFLEGMRVYFERHAWGNAALADFLAVHEETSGRDLGAWAEVWLRASGINALTPEVGEGVAILQEGEPLRPHRLAVGAFSPEGEKLVRAGRSELDVTGARTEVPELSSDAALVVLNDEDLTYAKVRFDGRSLETLREGLSRIEDGLSRAVCWRALWDMTRDGEWPAREFLATVLDHVHAETMPSAVQRILGQAGAAVSLLGDPANRDAAGSAMATAALEALRAAAAGSDLQLIWARTFAAAARTPEHLDLVLALLDGEERFGGLAMDTDLRWHLVRSLASAGRADEGLIAVEQERDPTDEGAREASGARAARPTAGAKAEAWEALTGPEPPRLASARAILAGFQDPEQEEVLAPYARRYFDTLDDAWERFDLSLALSFARGAFPSAIVSEETVAMTDEVLAREDLPGPIRRVLLEGRDDLLRALRARATDAAAG